MEAPDVYSNNFTGWQQKSSADYRLMSRSQRGFSPLTAILRSFPASMSICRTASPMGFSIPEPAENNHELANSFSEARSCEIFLGR